MARAELPDVHINTGAQSSERASLLAIQCTVNIVWGDLTIQNVLTFLYPCAVSSIVGASFGAVLRHVLRFGQRWSRIVHVLHPYGSKWVGCLWYFRSCSVGTNRVGLVELVGFFTCSIMNQLFSVSGWFSQPTQNPVEKRWVSTAITIVGSYPCVMSNAILFDTVGVWCPPSPGIRPCFSTQFNRKWLKCVLLVHFNHINENRSCQGLGNWARVRANNRVLKSNSARSIVNLLQSLQSAVESSTLLLESLEGVFFL